MCRRSDLTAAQRKACAVGIKGIRAYEALKGIAATGVMAFASDAKLRTEFDSLDDLPKRKRKATEA